MSKPARNPSPRAPRPHFARRHALSLIGCSSLAIALPMTSHAEGFTDDAKATLNLRNAYFNRNFTNPAYPQGKAEEWTQNFILDARSGFTQGPVGFGVDVLGLYSQKLDGGKVSDKPTPIPSNTSAATATAHTDKDDHVAVPGTVVLALLLLVTFVLYYFVNWKYLSEVWLLS